MAGHATPVRFCRTTEPYQERETERAKKKKPGEDSRRRQPATKNQYCSRIGARPPAARMNSALARSQQRRRLFGADFDSVRPARVARSPARQVDTQGPKEARLAPDNGDATTSRNAAGAADLTRAAFYACTVAAAATNDTKGASDPPSPANYNDVTAATASAQQQEPTDAPAVNSSETVDPAASAASVEAGDPIPPPKRLIDVQMGVADVRWRSPPGSPDGEEQGAQEPGQGEEKTLPVHADDDKREEPPPCVAVPPQASSSGSGSGESSPRQESVRFTAHAAVSKPPLAPSEPGGVPCRIEIRRRKRRLVVHQPRTWLPDRLRTYTLLGAEQSPEGKWTFRLDKRAPWWKRVTGRTSSPGAPSHTRRILVCRISDPCEARLCREFLHDVCNEGSS